MPVFKRSKIIGVIVHRLDSHFTTCALNGIESVTAASGYETIITLSQENADTEAANARMLLKRGVDGVIASLSAHTRGLAHFEDFAAYGVPVVYFDRVAATNKSDAVVIDNKRCGYLATEHLVLEGCRRIAIVTSGLERNVYAERWAGYRAALLQYDVPFTKDCLIVGDIDHAAGIEAARRILQMWPLPDGLFITNDLVAAICVNTLKEAGIRVPEDIAVVGFNNDPVGRLITPMLTTIDYNGYEMGRVAALRLVRQLSGMESLAEARVAVVESGLIVRGSSHRKVMG